MDNVKETDGMRLVYDRLTRVEERQKFGDDRMERLEAAIAKLDTKMDLVADDVKSAKTGLRIGLWFSTAVLPAVAGIGGWIAAHTWGK